MAGSTLAQKQSLTSASKETWVSFEYHDAKARSVKIAGTFNNWNTKANPLIKGLQGIWRISISLKPGRYQYRFYVDGQWRDDPKAKEHVSNEFGSQNACLTVR